MLVINDLSMGFGGGDLFSNVTLNLNPKERYGIVGANGSGKSTFLKVLSKEEQATGGTVEAANKSKIGFLKQDHFKYENEIILNVVLQGKPELVAAIEEKEQLLANSDFSEEDGMRLAHLEAVIAEQDGYVAETVAQTILAGLGIEDSKHYDEMKMLSGGYKLRVLLAQTLFSNPDILLLDEPTNHLDIVAIRWLEKYLIKDFKGVLAIVSHDRTFLRSLATSILDVDYGTVTLYPGSYDSFIRAKELAFEQKMITQKEKEKQVAHLQTFVDRFSAKASKAKQAQSRLKMIDRIKFDEILQSSRKAPIFKFETKRPSGKQVLSVEKISKSYQEHQVLENVNFNIGRTEKVGVIGPNGIGKSTLLKILMNNLSADDGGFNWGYETHVSYFAQDHHEVLNESISVFEWIRQETSGTDDSGIRKVLGNLLFTKDDVHKNIKNLSGGEAARVLFAKIRIAKGNVLVLDEPTNHLDMESIDALAESLKNYIGTILMVSHDRHFLQTVCDRIIVITKDGINDYNASQDHSIEDICKLHFLD